MWLKFWWTQHVVEYREDLLQRQSWYYRNKSVLITGGGGSIGSELARQIAKCEPSRLVLLDIYENGVYDIQQELLRRSPDLNLRVEIVSICDQEIDQKIISYIVKEPRV